MKQSILLWVIAAMLTSCGNDDKKATAAGNQTQTRQATNPETEKGLDLIANNDCLGCHKVADKFVGPPYEEVAKKYAGQPGIEDTLSNRIIKGSVGHWGDVQMTPHPNLSQEDAKKMVKYILTLNQ